MDTRFPSAFLIPIVFGASLCCAPTGYGDTAPCALLTQDQVSSTVGASVGAGAPIANTGCSWSTAGAPKVTVSVSMQSEKMFDAAKSSNPPQTMKTSVSGVGDEAVFTGVQGFASLWTKKGAKFLLVRIYGLPVNDAQTKLTALAKNALSKL